MTAQDVHLIPIVPAEAVVRAKLARRVVFPPSRRDRDDEFFPALDGIQLGGAHADVSFLYSHNRSPTNNFDRHLRTEEMFVPLDGDLCLPLAACREPGNPNEQPHFGDFVCVIVRHNEALIIRPNVWHNGGWPVDPERGVRYVMVLSGHRSGEGEQGHEDYIATRLPGAATIFPKW